MYSAPAPCTSSTETAGARALAMAVVMAKYPMPSAKRLLGMMSAAMVEEAVEPMPHPRPWIRRRPRMIPTTGKMAYDAMVHTMSAVPPMSIPTRPKRSSRAPVNTRTSVAVTVMSVVASPMTWASAPSWSIYTGRPMLSIWKPKNIERLMVDSIRKSRVKISPSDSRRAPRSDIATSGKTVGYGASTMIAGSIATQDVGRALR